MLMKLTAGVNFEALQKLFWAAARQTLRFQASILLATKQVLISAPVSHLCHKEHHSNPKPCSM